MNTRYRFYVGKLLLQAVGDCLAAEGKYRQGQRQELGRTVCCSVERRGEELGLSGGGVDLG